MTARKIHNTESGYIAERRNPHYPGHKVVIYRAKAQGIDVTAKYAVVCDLHATIGAAESIPEARLLMKHPSDFCAGCGEATP